jgi:hypothetical protein
MVAELLVSAATQFTEPSSWVGFGLAIEGYMNGLLKTLGERSDSDLERLKARMSEFAKQRIETLNLAKQYAAATSVDDEHTPKATAARKGTPAPKGKSNSGPRNDRSATKDSDTDVVAVDNSTDPDWEGVKAFLIAQYPADKRGCHGCRILGHGAKTTACHGLRKCRFFTKVKAKAKEAGWSPTA